MWWGWWWWYWFVQEAHREMGSSSSGQCSTWIGTWLNEYIPQFGGDDVCMYFLSEFGQTWEKELRKLMESKKIGLSYASLKLLSYFFLSTWVPFRPSYLKFLEVKLQSHEIRRATCWKFSEKWMVGFPQMSSGIWIWSMPHFMSIEISESNYRQDVDVKVCLLFEGKFCIESRYGQTWEHNWWNTN